MNRKRQDRPRHRRKAPSPPPPNMDLDALNELCEVLSVPAFMPDGEQTPIIRPRADFGGEDWDFMAFDRAVCAAGLKSYIRPASPADSLPGAEVVHGDPVIAKEIASMSLGGWIWVKEITPGLRTRIGVE